MDQRGDGPKRHLLYFLSTTKLSKGEPKKLGCGEVVSANLFAAPRCFFFAFRQCCCAQKVQQHFIKVKKKKMGCGEVVSVRWRFRPYLEGFPLGFRSIKGTIAIVRAS